MPARIAAAIGPCIGFSSYEVGPEFPAPFLAQTPDNAAFFRAAKRPRHHLFDLAGYVRARLAAAGVAPDRIHGRRYGGRARAIFLLSPRLP